MENLISVETQTSTEIDELNAYFFPLRPEERINELCRFFNEEEVLVTSSFGTKSAFLLHLIRKHRPSQVVHFIDTTYHFPQTLAYKQQLTDHLGLEVIDVYPDNTQNALTREEKWWVEHPRMCCTINKIVPLDSIKDDFTVWVSGLMSFQNDFRKHLNIFERQGDIIKFHPLIDLEEEEFLDSFSRLGLPGHPLESEGYGSIGCTHCTEKGTHREGRWKLSGKTECGLHTTYFKKKEQL